MSRRSDIVRFYRLLDRLEQNLKHEYGADSKPRLRECTGRMKWKWPERGVYFFFEDGEDRSDTGTGSRVVRVGSHAVNGGETSTLWERLKKHRGSASTGGGNNRNSIFRRTVGWALAEKSGISLPRWGIGKKVPHEVRMTELEHERWVSRVIGAMPLLWVEVADEPVPKHCVRNYVERNAIAMLSNCKKESVIDPSSADWLGRASDEKRWRVRESGLWNQRHVDEPYDEAFLDVLEGLVDGKQTNADRILDLLKRKSGLNDGEISEALDIGPLQSVSNQCSLLQRIGLVRREQGPRGGVANVLNVSTERPPSRNVASRSRNSRTRRTEQESLPPGVKLVPQDLSRTLVIVPGANRKRFGNRESNSGQVIAEGLSSELAQDLCDFREEVVSVAKVRERGLLPAWERFDGPLNEAAGDALRPVDCGAHVIFLDRAYGPVLSTEPIMHYDSNLRLSDWPQELLTSVLDEYARRQEIQSVRAFAHMTGHYREVLLDVRWSDTGIKDALLITPIASSPEGPRLTQLTSPRAQGEALADLMLGNLTTDWRSNDGARIKALAMD